MSLIENITILIEANREFINNKSNSNLKEKIRKLRYYFLISLKNSPEKSIVTKSYLEILLKNMDNENINNEEYNFIKKLHDEVEQLYIKSLKDLTLNQKRNFFSRNFDHILYEKNNQKVYTI